MPSSHLRDPDFRPMVRRAVLVAVVGWLVKTGVMLKVSNDLGGSVSVKRFYGIPYMSFEIGRNEFTQLTSKSTVAMCVVLSVMLVAGILRNKGRMHVAGWCTAFLSMGWTLLTDITLHFMRGQYTDMRRLKWAVFALIVSALLVAWWIAIEQPHSRLRSWRVGDSENEHEESWIAPAIST
jgi:hypothetical protein